jgi:hypothetical protein
MTSVEEASAFFRRRGFASVALTNQQAGVSFVAVGIKGDVESAVEFVTLPLCWGKHLLVASGAGWTVRTVYHDVASGEAQADDRRFDSLPDAVNAALARLQLYLLTGSAPDRE